MIRSLKLKNFRNFIDDKLFFEDKKNFIIWENGKWKTNILEAISMLTTNNLLKIDYENLVKIWENNFFIEAIFWNDNKISLAYDKQLNKKIYNLNGKKITKSKLSEISQKTVWFLPTTMNMFYLSPSLRRDFLDEIIEASYPEYSKYYTRYESIIKNRNKVLKNIREEKSKENELDFWNEQFIKACLYIYNYRFEIVDFLNLNIKRSKSHFWEKIKQISFVYKTKVNRENLEKSIRTYLEKNKSRDIIMASTSIWAHIDDFDILLDDLSIKDFASRWETKSIILDLKKLEIEFIENHTKTKVILLIDDLFSELDSSHKDNILKEFDSNQVIISSIQKIWNEEDKIHIL